MASNATLSTNVKVDDEVVYIDYPTENHYPAKVLVVGDRDGVSVDLDVFYQPKVGTRRNGVQHSNDNVAHTWHWPADA